MKRVVVGNCTDPNSVRDLILVTKEEHVVLFDSLNHEKKKHELMLGWSHDVMEEEINRMMHSDELSSFQKTIIIDLTPDSYRNIISENLFLVKKVMEYFVEYKQDVINITSIHFGILIESLLKYYRDLNLAINTSPDDLRKMISPGAEAYGLSEEKMEAGIKKLGAEDVLDSLYEKFQLLYLILLEINAPYDQDEYDEKYNSVFGTLNSLNEKYSDQDKSKLN